MKSGKTPFTAPHSPHSLLKLGANPFMLSMLAVVYAAEQKLPGNRAALLGHFVDTLLEREDLLDHEDQLLDGLRGLVWAMQQQRGSTSTSVQTTLPRDQVPAQIDETTLQQTAGTNILDAGDDVRFSHQLLQEYFTALTMQERLENGSLDAEKLWPPGEFWKPSGWEEATVLLAGLYETDCTLVLRWLLPANPEMVSRCIQRAGVSCDDRILHELDARWHSDGCRRLAATLSQGQY